MSKITNRPIQVLLVFVDGDIEIARIDKNITFQIEETDTSFDHEFGTRHQSEVDVINRDKLKSELMNSLKPKKLIESEITAMDLARQIRDIVEDLIDNDRILLRANDDSYSDDEIAVHVLT